MDSRDIKKEPRELENNDLIFNELFSLQKGLVDEYIKIEGLPQYPININTKKSQVLIKDFIGRVIEELSEGYESMIAVNELTAKNKFWYNLSLGDPNEERGFKLTMSHLQNVSEEMMDALHFFLELMIYVDINPSDFKAFTDQIFANDKEVRERVVELDSKDSNPLDYMTYFIDEPFLDVDSYCSINHVNMFGLYQEYGDRAIDPRMILMMSKVSTQVFHSKYPKVFWDITYNLNMARNCLKNKPWKQSEMMTDENLFRQYIMYAFMLMMALFKELLDNPKYDKYKWYEVVYWLYFKKNLVNHFRIKSKY